MVNEKKTVFQLQIYIYFQIKWNKQDILACIL